METSTTGNTSRSDGHQALTAKPAMDAQARAAAPHVVTADEGYLPETHRASAVRRGMKARCMPAAPAARFGTAEAIAPTPSTTALTARSRIHVILRPESMLTVLDPDRGVVDGTAGYGAGAGLLTALMTMSPMMPGRFPHPGNRRRLQSGGEVSAPTSSPTAARSPGSILRQADRPSMRTPTAAAPRLQETKKSATET
jgi:hypothetical protein